MSMIICLKNQLWWDLVVVHQVILTKIWMLLVTIIQTCQLSTKTIIIIPKSLKIITNLLTKARLVMYSPTNLWAASEVTLMVCLIISKIGKVNKAVLDHLAAVQSHPIKISNCLMFLISRLWMLWWLGVKMWILEVAQITVKTTRTIMANKIW